jgi:AcrR family transcriptional regulator
MKAKARSRSPRALRASEIPGEATRRRIMNVAEELFAERGFGIVSLREILVQAGANAASAHYHFGSKEELIRQVFARRAPPVLAHINELLDTAASFAGKPNYLERVVFAIIAPSINGRSPQDHGARILNRLRAHLLTEQLDFAGEIHNEVYRDVAERVLAALRVALPAASPIALAWKLHVVFGALGAATTWVTRMHPALASTYNPDNPDEALAYLVPLFVAVLRAPAPSDLSK